MLFVKNPNSPLQKLIIYAEALELSDDEQKRRIDDINNTLNSENTPEDISVSLLIERRFLCINNKDWQQSIHDKLKSTLEKKVEGTDFPATVKAGQSSFTAF